MLSQPIYDGDKIKSMGYWLVKVLERKEESEEARVQAILLGSQEQAQSVKERLEAGEDFAALAQELSQHEPSKESGGDLDWLTPGIVCSAFDEFVFNSELDLDIVSEPIGDENAWTKGGYWLIKVLDKDDNRKIEDDDRELLMAKALNEWFSSLRDDPENEIENYLDEDKKSWAILRAIKELEG
ncbi:Foldase protein PrsA [subsurface metagenome]